MRQIFLLHADTHGGHWLGLLNPKTKLAGMNDSGEEIEWTPKLSATQRWLWRWYTKFIGQVVDLAGDDEIVVCHVGDITHGTRFGRLVPGIQPGDQVSIATWNLKPLTDLQNVKQVILVTGTEVHVPNSIEATISRIVRLETGKRVQTLHQGRVDLGREWLDVAHHGAHPGTRDWLRGNIATIYCKTRVYEDRRLGVVPAVLYARGHYHTLVHVTVNETWKGVDEIHHLLIVPSMSGPTRHSIKSTQSTPSLTVGMVALEVIDGRLHDIHKFKRERDIRVKVKI